MSKYAAILGIIMYAAITYSQDPSRFEIGVMIGEPTGISTKYWLSRNDAIDAAAGWSFTDDIVDLAVDYQRHFFLIDLEKGELPFYLGVGAGLQLGNREGEEDEAFFGARIPVGIVYMFENSPISIFGEIAPIMEIIPETDVRLSGGLGIRLRFGRI